MTIETIALNRGLRMIWNALFGFGTNILVNMS